MDVYKLAEELSDMVWHYFDKWNKKVQNTVGNALAFRRLFTKPLMRGNREPRTVTNERYGGRCNDRQDYGLWKKYLTLHNSGS